MRSRGLCALLAACSLVWVQLVQADDGKAQAKIPGLDVRVIAKQDDLGDTGFFARFTNRSKESRFIVRPMDGSDHKMCIER